MRAFIVPFFFWPHYLPIVHKIDPSKWAGKQLRLIVNNDSIFKHDNLIKIIKNKTVSSKRKTFSRWIFDFKSSIWEIKSQLNIHLPTMLYTFLKVFFYKDFITFIELQLVKGKTAFSKLWLILFFLSPPYL